MKPGNYKWFKYQDFNIEMDVNNLVINRIELDVKFNKEKILKLIDVILKKGLPMEVALKYLKAEIELMDLDTVIDITDFYEGDWLDLEREMRDRCLEYKNEYKREL